MRVPHWDVNGRYFVDYEAARMYFEEYGGVFMAKPDHMTPAYVLQTAPLKYKRGLPNA
jgi:hypothetical protein